MKWSDSADKLFRTCQRKYYFSVLVAHPTAKDALRAKAFRLSRLMDLNKWRGHLVHTAISEYLVPVLVSGRMPDFEEVKQKTLALAREQEAFSERKEYEQVSKTKARLHYCMLECHYLGGKLDEGSRNKIWTDVNASIDKLALEIPLLKKIIQGKQHSSEEPIRFHLGGILVESRPDIVFRSRENEIVIIDWKRYRSVPGNSEEQLSLYAYSVIRSRKWGDQVEADNTRLYEVNVYQQR
jgi:hypothetical protein